MSADVLERTESQTDFDAQFEAEFAKPCEFVNHITGEGCDRTATWAVWLRHHKDSCSITLHYCTEHKDWSIKSWEHIVECHSNMYCMRCGPTAGQFAGPVENFIRALEL